MKGDLLKSFDIPARKKHDGFAYYKSYGCKLEFKFFEKKSGAEIPTETSSGLAKAYWTKEAIANSQSVSVHTLKEKWLKVEQHFSPIVITDFPVDAYWLYYDNLYNEKDNSDIWRTLDEASEVIDLNLVTPLWVSSPIVEKMSKSRYNVVTPDDQEIYPTYELDIKCCKENRY